MFSPRSYKVKHIQMQTVFMILYGFLTALELIHNFKVEKYMLYSVLQLTKPSLFVCAFRSSIFVGPCDNPLKV